MATKRAVDLCKAAILAAYQQARERQGLELTAESFDVAEILSRVYYQVPELVEDVAVQYFAELHQKKSDKT